MLTQLQRTTLKADIALDPVLSALPNNSDSNFDIAAAYNQQASPAYRVWRTSVPVNEIMGNGFDWTRIDNLTVGKARIWEFMTQLGSINFGLANVRAGILAAFSAGGDVTMRSAIFGHGNRTATRVEKLFATGSGTAPTDQGVGPSTLGYEGLISYNDVEQARNS